MCICIILHTSYNIFFWLFVKQLIFITVITLELAFPARNLFPAFMNTIIDFKVILLPFFFFKLRPPYEAETSLLNKYPSLRCANTKVKKVTGNTVKLA